MAVIVSISNQKGGVGKTTTAINLSTAFAAIKKKVLLVDLDPQGNATTGLGIYATKKGTSYELLIGAKTLSEVILKTSIPNLSIIPSNINLIGAEIELVQVQNRETILKTALSPYNDIFDYIVIDSPPSMGILTLNALVSSNEILVPLQCEYYALEGLRHLVNSVKKIRNTFNKELKISGIVLTMYDTHSDLSISVERDARANLGNLVFNTVIPRDTKIAESSSYGRPVLIYATKSSGSCAYMALAKEFLNRHLCN